MNAWIHLVRKELRLGFVAFLIPIIAFTIVALIAGYFGNRTGYFWEAVGSVALFATGMQVFYLVYYLFISLNTEQKRLHLWIHSPIKGYGLLSAKLVAGLISLFVTMLITGIIGWISYQKSDLLVEAMEHLNVIGIAFFGATHLILSALGIAITFVFFWIIYLVFKNNFNSFVSFILTFILFIVTTVLYGYFIDSSVYEFLTMWGEIKFTWLFDNMEFYMQFLTPDEFAEMQKESSIYLGFYIFETIVSLIMFFIASWLLDRKVEV